MPATSHRARVKFTFPPPRPLLPSGPERHSLIVGGRLAVAVNLMGALGRGKQMVLDVFVWERIKLVLGADWCRKSNGFGGSYVVTTRKRATAYANGQPILILARHIALAGHSDRVTYRDGDMLNLTQGNLELVSHKELGARAFGVARSTFDGATWPW